MTRRTRQVGTLVLTAAAIAYLVWKIELATTLDVLADTNLAWFALAVTIMVVTVPVLALRWGWLLASHEIHERVPWLTRAYFVAYTAGQVLPTSLGGDAVRVVETTRRHPGRATVVTGTVLLERGLGGAATRCARRDRVPALDRRVRRQRVPVARGRLRLRDARARLPLLRALGPAAACAGRSRSSSGSGSRSRCAASTKASTTSAAIRGLLGKVFAVTLRRAGGAHPRDLGGGQGGRHRPRPADLLRLRPAALPRDARAVHAQRPRRARGLLRELPRERRRRREPGVRRGLPVLPRDAAARFPGRA